MLSDGKLNILVIGDIILDEYRYVDSKRLSPEDPSIPVYDDVYSDCRPGGALNVARNIKFLLGDFAKVTIAGICSDLHEVGKYISGDVCDYWLVDGAKSPYNTMRKTRFFSGLKYLFRVDNIKKFNTAYIPKNFFSEWCKNHLSENLKDKRFDVVVFSDYDKGTLNETLISEIKKLSVFSVVDSKRSDLSIFGRCNILKVNSGEYEKSKTHHNQFTYVVKTSDNGADVFTNTGFTSNHRVKRLDAIDLTGAGDTHTAALASSLVYRWKNWDDFKFAVEYANVCAGDVVMKLGTSVPNDERKFR